VAASAHLKIAIFARRREMDNAAPRTHYPSWLPTGGFDRRAAAAGFD
jgi:hypothetical protein